MIIWHLNNTIFNVYNLDVYSSYHHFICQKKGIKTMQNQMLNEYILEGEGVTVSVGFMFL